MPVDIYKINTFKILRGGQTSISSLHRHTKVKMVVFVLYPGLCFAYDLEVVREMLSPISYSEIEACLISLHLFLHHCKDC